jgi:DNA invertase Pin-like site-specific DNA recombinase
MKIAISYLRFSSMIQASGDSCRRQNASRDQWLLLNPDVTLEKELNDFGLSAFKAHHVSKGDLGDFLEFIKTPSFAQRIETDEVFLLVESLDRLSRERIMTALHQLELIVKAGIKVVTLADGHTYDRDSLNDLGGLIVAIVTMSRAYNESAEKSRRIRAVFQSKRDGAKSGQIYCDRPTAWIRVVDGKYSIVANHARVIRKVIQDVAKGISIAEVCRRLTNDKTPPISEMREMRKTSIWHPSTIKCLLQVPSPIGTLRTKDGDIENHFPPIIDLETWAKAQQVLKNNASDRGRKSKTHSNFLRKIATDPLGDPIYLKARKNNNHSYLPKMAHLGHGFPNALWSKNEIDLILIHSMRLALKVESESSNEESRLALLEIDIEKLEKKILNLEELLEDEPDKGLLKRKQDREIEKNAKKREIQDIKEIVLSKNQKTILDPSNATDEEIYQALRSNIQKGGLIVDFKQRTIRVKLVNGVKYKATLTTDKEVIIETNDFDVSPLFCLSELTLI